MSMKFIFKYYLTSPSSPLSEVNQATKNVRKHFVWIVSQTGSSVSYLRSQEI